jgi:hypothetical protein
MIAYCGLNCGTCPIHLATLEQDPYVRQTMRISISNICTEQYGMKLQPHEINDCDGCRANLERIFITCRNCQIRKCAQERKLDSCAYCADYACEQLLKIFGDDPGAQTRLEELRKTFIP